MLLISKSKYTPYRPKLLSLMWLFLNFYSMAEQSFIKKQVSQSSSVPRLQKNLKQNINMLEGVKQKLLLGERITL